MYKSIVEAVMEHSKNSPDKLAIADEHTSYTYKELVSAVNETSLWFEGHDIVSGDYIMIQCSQDTDFLILNLACQLKGIAFAILEKNASFERANDIYNEINAKCLISMSEYVDIPLMFKIKDVVSQERNSFVSCEYMEQNSVCEILFTTGTTGHPKGIVISHKANVALAENIGYGVEMTNQTIELIPLPLSHSHGLRTCYANFLFGGCVIIIDGITNIKLFFDILSEYKVSALDITPTIAKLLVKVAKKGLMSIAEKTEYIEIGTAILDDEIKQQLKELFPNTRLYNFYGSTEAGRTCVLDFNEFDKPFCIGKPTTHAAMFVVDNDKNIIQSSKSVCGTIAVSGNMMMDCYWNDPQTTKNTLVNNTLYTNDLGYVDENGYFFILGRNDDVINFKGIKIAPEEIETIALKFDGIVDCACIPIADPICGQKPKLFISVNNESSFNLELYQQYLNNVFDPSKKPTIVEIINTIPRSTNGKLQRKQLQHPN